MENGHKPVFLPIRRGSKGQGLVEYALVIAPMALVCVGVIALLGPAISSFYAEVYNTLSGTPPPASTPTLEP